MEHFNKLTPGEAERLAILSEELAESVSAVGKILRHGYRSSNPNKPEKDNRQLLVNELGDVQAAMRCMYNARDIDPRKVKAAELEKLNRPNRYLHHQNDVISDGKLYIVVAGSRSWNDYQEFSRILSMYLKMIRASNFVIVSGAARKGADAMAIRWAEENGVEYLPMPADWDEFGKSAGFIRNADMGVILTHALAFWDKKSIGTKNMIEIAASKPNTNVMVFTVEPDKE